MNLLSFPATDSFAETIETFSEDAYIFCAPETVDWIKHLKENSKKILEFLYYISFWTTRSSIT